MRKIALSILLGVMSSSQVRWRMTPLQAIQISTINHANLFGMSHDIGSIEARKYADIIAVKGNPLKDITVLEHIKFVMKNGKSYKNNPRLHLNYNLAT